PELAVHRRAAEGPRPRPLEPLRLLVGDADGRDVLVAYDDLLLRQALEERFPFLRDERPPGRFLTLRTLLQEARPQASRRRQGEHGGRGGRPERSGPPRSGGRARTRLVNAMLVERG